MAASYQVFNPVPTVLREMGLTDVFDDFVSSLARGVDIGDLAVIKEEGRGPVLDVGLMLGPGRRFTAYFHLPPADSPAASQAKDELVALAGLTDWASFRRPVHRVDFIWDGETRSWQEWQSTPPPNARDPGTYELISQIWIGVAALWFLGKLADAYVSRLADRLAESTFKAAARISLRRRNKRDYVRIEVPEGTTMIVLPPDLSDDAREAFIDLDPTAGAIRGKTLYWDQEQRTWISCPRIPDED